MCHHLIRFTLAAVLAVSPLFTKNASAGGLTIQLGPRPFYLEYSRHPAGRPVHPALLARSI